MKKRISSMVLALIMVITLLPTTAFAASSYLMQKNAVGMESSRTYTFSINGAASVSRWEATPGDNIVATFTGTPKDGMEYSYTKMVDTYDVNTGGDVTPDDFEAVCTENDNGTITVTCTFTMPEKPTTGFSMVNLVVVCAEPQPDPPATPTPSVSLAPTSGEYTAEYDSSNYRFVAKATNDTDNDATLTEGSVQFYLNDDAIGDPVSYSNTYFGYEIVIATGESSSYPQFNMGENKVKAVYTWTDGTTTATSSDVTFTLTKKDISNAISIAYTTSTIYYDGYETNTRAQINVDSDQQYDDFDVDNVTITATLDEQPHTLSSTRRTDTWMTFSLNDAGTYVITISVDDENTYYKGTKSQEVTVNPLVAELEWSDDSIVFDGTEQEVTVTVTNAITGDTFEPTYTGNKGTEVGNTYSASITDLGNANYTLVGTEDTTHSWSITQSGTDFGDDGIVADQADKTYTYGETMTFTVTPEPTGVAPVVMSRAAIAPTTEQMALYATIDEVETLLCDAVNADVNGMYTMTYKTTDKLLDVGTHTITAKYVGNDNMADYSEDFTIEIVAKEVTAAVTGTITKTYDGTAMLNDVALNIPSNELAHADDEVTLAATATYNSVNVANAIAVELSNMSKSGNEASYYDVSLPTDVTGNITKAIHADETTTGSAMYGNEGSVSLSAWTELDGYSFAIDKVTAGSDYLVADSYSISNDTLVFTFENDANNKGKTATIDVTVSSTNYENFTVSVVVTVLDAQDTLSFTNSNTLVYGETLGLSVTGGSTGGAVTYTVQDGTGSATISGTTLTPVTAGTVTVTATMAGDSTYADVSATQTVTIAKAEQTAIAFTSNNNVVVDGTLTLGTTAGAEVSGDVTYALADGDTDYATLEGGVLTGVSVGMVTITATKAGDANYNDASTSITVFVLASDADTITTAIVSGSATITNEGVSGESFDIIVVDTISDTDKNNFTIPSGYTEGKTFYLYVLVNNIVVEDATFSGTITVTIPYDVVSGKTYQVLHQKQNGEFETLSVTANVSAQTLSFAVSELSPFMVVSKTTSSGSSGSNSSSTYYDITIGQSGSGTISPDGGSDSELSIKKYNSQTFTFTPSSGYQVSDVLIDGISIGAVSSYTFSSVTGDHTLFVVFSETGAHTNPQTGVDVFDDVTESDWFYNSVMTAYENGWVSGTGDNTYSPYLTTSRAMVVTILYRMENAEADLNALSFADVSVDDWFAEGVAWAKENGIVSGYSEEIFAPNDPITREQMAAILYRYAEYKGLDMTATTSLDEFTDGDTTSEYAVAAMTWAVANDIFNGNVDGSLAPTNGLTRAELAVLLTRFAAL